MRAAAAAGVERVVKISASPASIFPGTPAEAAADHLAVEEQLAQSPIRSTTAVRPNGKGTASTQQASARRRRASSA